MSTPARFKDPLRTIESFGETFLVVCPACGGCAHVDAPAGRDAAVRFVCPSCGRSEQWRGSRSITYYRWPSAAPAGVVCIGGPIDWYFHYPVWLTIPCCGELLWAYNEEHLDFIERYVSATLRERAAAPAGSEVSVRNSSLASRLPSWMTAAKNRRRILAAIATLRHRTR